jgi:DnaJ-class molecular chaperone
MTPKIKEHICPECGGTGFASAMQPAQAGRKIYPPKCELCEGKGKVTDDN